MRTIVTALAMLTGVALFAAVPGQSQSAPVKNLKDCDGTYSGTFRNVTVQEGGTCILTSGAEVVGGVHAKPGAANLIVHTDVSRNIQAHGVTGTVLIGPKGCRFDPTVGNNVHVTASHNVLICAVTSRNNILVTDNDGRISVRDSVAGNNIHVDRNLAWVKDGAVGHNRPGAIRLLRDKAGNHIHVFHNDDSRVLVLKGNSPDPIVK
jgi:hypothetical protein